MRTIEQSEVNVVRTARPWDEWVKMGVEENKVILLEQGVDFQGEAGKFRPVVYSAASKRNAKAVTTVTADGDLAVRFVASTD